MIPPRPQDAPGAGATLLLGAAMAIVAAATVTLLPVAAHAEVPIYDYEIVHTYPHDTHAFTEGLFYLNGDLYESTGLDGQSSIRRERLETGEVLQRIDIPDNYFGEGIVSWGNRLVQLTWQSQVGFVYDLASFKRQKQFSYAGEGWGLTRNGRWIIMSDGTAQLRLLNPQTLAEAGRIPVTLDGRALGNLNELEWVRGEIYANIWQTNWIARIDPATGHVVGMIDLRGILPSAQFVPGQTDVLNGIAYDARRDRLFVTGKDWPTLFQIRLRRRVATPPASHY
jgi:glutaminyl-peptide cyclotransferase